MARAIAAAACAALSALALAAGGIAAYSNSQLLNSERFADRAVTALDSRVIRRALSERIVTEAIDRGSPDLATARPLLVLAVDSMLETRSFAALARTALRNAHVLLLDRDGRELAIDLADATALLRSTLKSSNPELADLLPHRLDLQIASLRDDAAAARILDAADRVRWAAVVLPLVGVLLLVGAVVVAADRDRALRRAPLVIAAAALWIIVVERLARPEVARAAATLDVDELDSAVGELWVTLVGDLRTWALLVGAVALASWAFAEPGLRQLGRAALAASTTRLAGVPRLVRAPLLAGAGIALVALSGSRGGAAIALGVGLLLIAVGVADGLTAVAGRAHTHDVRPTRPRRIAVAVTVTALVPFAAALLFWHTAGDTRAERRAEAASGLDSCNGALSLCDRRLNEVVFAGTHNSMSAADSPGWLFANQRRNIPRQLSDGIRLLLLDAHWGVRRRDGLVRTDLEAEGTSRNKVVETLGPEATLLAERLVGAAGLGGVSGRGEVYLCHTLCELGATRMRDTLRLVKSFIDGHAGDVVILLIEPSVPSWAIEREFRSAGLIDRVAVLDRDRPLPTLLELAAQRRQLVVFGERDTAGVTWYHDAFSFIQDTPLGRVSTSSCAKERGDLGSPLMMVNHWVDSFPPPANANGRIARRNRLNERVHRCERQRGVRPSLVAVDWYNLGDIVEVARELNGIR